MIPKLWMKTLSGIWASVLLFFLPLFSMGILEYRVWVNVGETSYPTWCLSTFSRLSFACFARSLAILRWARRTPVDIGCFLTDPIVEIHHSFAAVRAPFRPCVHVGEGSDFLLFTAPEVRRGLHYELFRFPYAHEMHGRLKRDGECSLPATDISGCFVIELAEPRAVVVWWMEEGGVKYSATLGPRLWRSLFIFFPLWRSCRPNRAHEIFILHCCCPVA